MVSVLIQALVPFGCMKHLLTPLKKKTGERTQQRFGIDQDLQAAVEPEI